jgi:16S rRNA (guanine966-N2)-methyltransferase
MRITGGTLKGWQPEDGFANHVRPTTDRVRESLFNQLTHNSGIESTRVLDLFSGSGIIALEFISRGAAEVVSVDRDVKNIRHQQKICKQKQLGQWQIVKADVLKFVNTDVSGFDYIFADPPYDMPGVQELVRFCLPLLKEDGWLILEHTPSLQFSQEPIDVRNYGSTTCSIFAKT